MNARNQYLFGVGRVVVVSVVVLIIVAAFSGFAWYYCEHGTSTTSSMPFSLNVETRPLRPASIEESHKGMLGVVGQKCMFLVSIEEESYGSLK